MSLWPWSVSFGATRPDFDSEHTLLVQDSLPLVPNFIRFALLRVDCDMYSSIVQVPQQHWQYWHTAGVEGWLHMHHGEPRKGMKLSYTNTYHFISFWCFSGNVNVLLFSIRFLFVCFFPFGLGLCTKVLCYLYDTWLAYPGSPGRVCTCSNGMKTDQ